MDNRLKNALAVLAGLLLLVLIVVAAAIGKDKVFKPVDKSRTIVMSAEGKVTAKPDVATVMFSVVTQGKDPSTIQKNNDLKMTKVIDFLKSQGVKSEDIQTTNYNLYPQYSYPQNAAPEITGYSSSQQVSAKIRNLDTVKDIVGGLTSQGVNQIDNVSYSINDPDALKAEARQKAIDQAREKAEVLVKGLGVKLGRVVSFTEGDMSTPFPPYPMMDRGYGGGGGAPLEPGTQDVIVSVTVTFELK